MESVLTVGDQRIGYLQYSILSQTVQLSVYPNDRTYLSNLVLSDLALTAKNETIFLVQGTKLCTTQRILQNKLPEYKSIQNRNLIPFPKSR